MGDILSTVEKPTEERILDIYDQVEATHKAEGHAFFALLFKEIQKVFPFFSSRDVRNIQSAISLRLTDFDLEQDWFENPGKSILKRSTPQIEHAARADEI